MKTSFKKHALFMAVLSAMNPMTTYADESEKDEDVEVIEIKGQRANMISAQNLKMAGDTVMDAISAEDMGSLPDRSVLEAISRVPGVSLERFAAADDPDHFGVEGGGIVVRGLSHTRSEFNNRDSFSATSGRGLSFEDVSPEMLGSVEIYKNQTADMIEGGISGTINLNTRKPFDYPGQAFAFSLDSTYADMRKEHSPTGSFLISDRWETEIGRFGALANFSNSKLKVRSDGVQAGIYRAQAQDPNQYVPKTTRIARQDTDRERTGGGLSLQWESPEKQFLVTAEFIHSTSESRWNERGTEFNDESDVNSVSLHPIDGTQFEFDQGGYFQSGIITSEAGWRGDGAPLRTGLEHTRTTRFRDDESEVNDYSINVKYTPNDHWKFQYDLQYIESDAAVLDVSMFGSTRMVVGLDLTSADVPKVELWGPQYDGQEDYQAGTPFLDPSTHYFNAAMDHISDNDGNELATRFDAEYTFDDSIVSSVMFGLRYSDREQTTRESTYNWQAISAGWTGNGIQWFGDHDASLYEQVSFDNFARGGVLTAEGGNTFLFPSMSLLNDYANLADNISALNPAAWSPLSARADNNSDFIDNEINETKEQSSAAYFRINLDGEIGDYFYSMNAGLRYVKLENETAGFNVFPTLQDDRILSVLNGTQRAFVENGGQSATASKNSYTNVLPSFNFKLEVTDEFLVRFGFSEAIAMPDLGLLRNYVAMSGYNLNIEYEETDPDVPVDQRTPTYAEFERFIASSGNPFLKPLESYNYDLSLEWYFEESSYLALSLFYKEIENYFINGVSTREFTNNGVTVDVDVSGAVNGGMGYIGGAELSYQQFFDQLPGAWGGLGVQANYTYIDENGSPNSGLSSDASSSDESSDIAFADSLPLEGLSQDTANLAVMYEKFGISARVAYNWRSSYLLTTRDVITFLPIYNEAGGQVDASVFYELNDNMSVGLQVTNLNDNVTKTSMQIDDAGNTVGRSWFTNDRRYSVVLKGNF